MRKICFTALAIAAAAAQPPNPGAIPGAPAAPVRRGPRAAFPQHAQADQATIDRGKALYGVNCAGCHGSDARGGEGGPMLLRSQIVLNDQNGETLATIVQSGRGAMPKFNLAPAQISDIAAFLHSFRVGGYDVSRMTPPSIVTGDPQAGEAYFNATCRSCHSAAGDLKGIASKITDPKQLQQTWLMPGGGRAGFRPGGAPRTDVPPTTVTVTLPGGQLVEGHLDRIDDFFVTLTDKEGAQRTFARNGATPKVAIHDPLQPHKDLLRTYSDKDIHNLTAYLVTLK